MDEPPGETSAAVRARVMASRERQQARQQPCANARLDAGLLRRHCRLEGEAQTLLQTAMRRWQWSARATHRVLKVARTVADLAGREDIAKADVAEAMQDRQAVPGA
jgi:magnesium chelatase family protein